APPRGAELLLARAVPARRLLLDLGRTAARGQLRRAGRRVVARVVDARGAARRGGAGVRRLARSAPRTDPAREGHAPRRRLRAPAPRALVVRSRDAARR